MTIKKNGKTYTAEFKAEALKLAERVGVVEAVRQSLIRSKKIDAMRCQNKLCRMIQ